MDLTPHTMSEVLEQTAKTKAALCAIDFMGCCMTYATLDKAVSKFARGIQGLGLKEKTHIGLFMPNCPLAVIAYYGILRAGHTVVNYNPLYAKGELIHQINDSDTSIMVTLDLNLMMEKLDGIFDQTPLQKIVIGRFSDYLPFPKNLLFPIVKKAEIYKRPRASHIIYAEELMDNDGTYAHAQIDLENDLAVLQYTGGTTGVPKGAMLTHANIYVNALQCYSNFPDADPGVNGGHEKMLAVLPFFHVFAMTVCLNMAVLAGMEIVTIPRFDLKQALKLLHKKRPQYMPAVPAIFNAINNTSGLDKFDMTSLRFCISGGAPLPEEVKKSFEAKTGCTVVEGYGLSESSPVSTVNPPFGENISGTIGLPLPQTIIEIIDPDDKKTPVPLGEKGEVCITGPQVMKGYYNNVKASDDVLREGEHGTRLHTGDIGVMDENGYTRIVDRIKDLIITNGYNVYPRNIEEAIYKHGAVEECIVAGLPCPNRGEIVKAWIKLKDGQSLNGETLKTFLADKISPMEIPKRIEFRTDPLPKTMIGKLSRKDIVAEESGNEQSSLRA